MKTYSKSVRRMTFNTRINTNENFNYQTTGSKNDYAEFNTITEEDKKDLKEKDVIIFFFKNFKIKKLNIEICIF